MDRNSVIGLVIIGAILIGFTIWSTPNKDELAIAQRRADSLAYISQQKQMEQSNQQKQNDTAVAKVVAADTLSTKVLQDKFGSFADAAKGENKIYSIENELIKLEISNKGARPYRVELKKYKTSDKQPLYLLAGDSTVFGFNFFTQNNRTISTNELFFQSNVTDTVVVVTNTDTVKILDFRLYAGKDSYIEYIYKVRPNSYKVDFDMNFVNMAGVISSNTRAIDLNWQMFARAQEKQVASENTLTSVYYKFSGDEVEQFEISASETEPKTENIRNRIKWIAFKQQFFSAVLIANTNFENATVSQRNILDSTRFLKEFKSEIGLPFQKADSQNIALAFYFGPNHYQTLKSYNMDLEELVTLGSWIIKWINRFLIIPVFNFLNQYILNFGIIILLLTLIVKLILFPLTYKSYLSMAKMRVLKPQIDELNEKIPADKPMERQQASMALYRKVGVNPLGGCLPLLLQMPILIAMFRFFPSSIELRQQSFLWATDLSTYDAIVTWTTQIPLISSTFGNHISLFNILMTITTIITIWMNNQVNVSQQQFPGMKTMMYIMPVMFMFVLNSFSAGLTYYYFLANVITILQNEIFRRSINEEKLLHQLNENKKKPVKKSSFQAKLEEAAKKRGYNVKK